MRTPDDAVHVGAALVFRDAHVLACQRRHDQSHPGKWEFPGGKREVGESIEECVRRELREELGIEVEVGELVWQMVHTYPQRQPVALFFFRVDRFAGEIDNRVFAEVRWVPAAQLPELDFLEADRELVARLADGSIGV